MYSKTIKRKNYPKIKEKVTAYADIEIPAAGRS